MNLQKFEELTAKEQAEFSRICNLLLSCTYILRENAEQRISREYTFIERNFQLFEDYLSLSGWDIKKDTQYGVIYIRNINGCNKLVLSKLATVILITLRIFYEEQRMQAGLTNNVSIAIGELFGKIVNEYSIYPKKPPQKDIRDVFRMLESHNLIRKIGESYDDLSCRIQILPSILIVVPNERCKTICDILKTEKEVEQHEEADTIAAH